MEVIEGLKNKKTSMKNIEDRLKKKVRNIDT